MTSIISNFIRVKITVLLFGRYSEIVGTLQDYTRPYLKIKTREGIRLFHESIVKEIIPLNSQQTQTQTTMLNAILNY